MLNLFFKYRRFYEKKNTKYPPGVERPNCSNQLAQNQKSHCLPGKHTFESHTCYPALINRQFRITFATRQARFSKITLDTRRPSWINMFYPTNHVILSSHLLPGRSHRLDTQCNHLRRCHLHYPAIVSHTTHTRQSAAFVSHIMICAPHPTHLFAFQPRLCVIRSTVQFNPWHQPGSR